MFSFVFLISTLAITLILLSALLANEIADFLELRRKNQELRDRGLLHKTKFSRPKNVRFTPNQPKQ